MIKVYERTEGDETMFLTIAQGLAELDRAANGGRRYVKSLVSWQDGFRINYKDGRVVMLRLVNNPKLAVRKV